MIGVILFISATSPYPLPFFGRDLPKKRTLPKTLYHVTTEKNWERIQQQGTLKPGEGYGWEERQGVFALGWQNWIAKPLLHYFSFLTLKLQGPDDKLVVIKIRLTPALINKTRVALIAPTDSESGQAILAKVANGRFADIPSLEDVIFLESYGKNLIRNTFTLREFVREVPPSDNDPVEYIIESDVSLDTIEKIAEIATSDIPQSILDSGKHLKQLMDHRKATGEKPKQTAKKALPLADKLAVVRHLYQSRHQLRQPRQKALCILA